MITVSEWSFVRQQAQGHKGLALVIFFQMTSESRPPQVFRGHKFRLEAEFSWISLLRPPPLAPLVGIGSIWVYLKNDQHDGIHESLRKWGKVPNAWYLRHLMLRHTHFSLKNQPVQSSTFIGFQLFEHIS